MACEIHELKSMAVPDRERIMELSKRINQVRGNEDLRLGVKKMGM